MGTGAVATGLEWAHDIWQADCLSQQVLDRLVLQSAAPWQRHKLLKPLGGLSTARRKVLDYVMLIWPTAKP
jgi:AraC family transcriptional regulator